MNDFREKSGLPTDHFYGVAALVVLAVVALACEDKPPPPESRELARKMFAGVIGDPKAAYELVYRLYVPPKAQRSDQAPLIVFLHSSGANGSDNVSHLGAADVGRFLTRAQQIEGSFVVAPQCPSGHKWITGSEHAPYLNYDQDQREESDAIQLVLLLVDELQRKFPIDSDRIYLTGASSGAAGTWDVITRREDHPFAAAIPVTGIGDPNAVDGITEMPIWTFHGAKDRGSPVANTREMVAALRRRGSPIKYTEYPNVGHNSWSRAYSEPGLFEWLFAQRRSAWRKPSDSK